MLCLDDNAQRSEFTDFRVQSGAYRDHSPPVSLQFADRKKRCDVTDSPHNVCNLCSRFNRILNNSIIRHVTDAQV